MTPLQLSSIALKQSSGPDGVHACTSVTPGETARLRVWTFASGAFAGTAGPQESKRTARAPRRQDGVCDMAVVGLADLPFHFLLVCASSGFISWVEARCDASEDGSYAQQVRVVGFAPGVVLRFDGKQPPSLPGLPAFSGSFL